MKYFYKLLFIISILILFWDYIIFVRSNKTPNKWNNIYYNKLNFFKDLKIKFSHIYSFKKLNKDVCHENLQLIHKIFKKYKIFFWLSEGTALGFRRNNDFIDYDDDLDIGIWHKDSYKLLNALPELKKHGFEIALIRLDNSFIILHRKNEKIDIDMTGKGINCIAHSKSIEGEPCDNLLEYLDSFNKITIKNKKYNLPKDKYYKKLYGNSWKTPIKGKQIMTFKLF